MFRPARAGARPRLDAPVLLGTAAAALLAFAVMPDPASLGDEVTGDPELGRTVRDLAGGSGFQSLSVAVVENGAVRTAGLGTTGGPGPSPVDDTTPYEIGSIAKGLTGMVLADSALDPDTPLREVLPGVRFRDADVADATLAELSSHRAGLPRLRTTPASLARTWVAQLTGIDPYSGDADDLRDDVAAASSSGRPAPVSYSNLGAAALGLALAEDAGTTYPDLLAERILRPLGMDATLVASDESDLPTGRAHGHRANGMSAEPWLEHGRAGAGGGVWSTAGDLATLLQALLDGSAPGADAATPRFEAGEGERIGFGWFTEYADGREVTWHNGGTGGFRSWAGYDAAAGVGVVVLGNTDRAVEPIGRQLIGLDAGDGGLRPILMVGVTALLTLGGLWVFVSRKPDRLGLTEDAATGAFFLIAARGIGTWETIPPVFWLLAVAAFAWGTGTRARRWPALPWRAHGRTWARVAGTAASVALVVGVLAGVVLL